MLDYDKYLERETERYYEEQESNMMVSNCCDATIEDESNDICPECNEHCVITTHGEYKYEEYENAMCDKADSRKETQRERERDE